MIKRTYARIFISIALFFLITQYAIGFKPVVIIPGLGGSQLEAKLDKPSVNHFYCSRRSDWYTIWFSITQLIPPFVNCWADNIKLLWDPSTNKYSNNHGISTRVPFSDGSTLNFEYLDPSLIFGKSNYFHTLVEAMVGAGGVRNVSIRGSPYDFRYAPFSAYNGTWISKITTLVEETYEINNRTKVTVLSHSMGCLYALWFLNQKSHNWKEKYILRWLPTGGVFSGAGLGVKQLLTGDISIIPLPGLAASAVREEQRSYESNMMLLPSPQIWGNNTIIYTPRRNYTSRDYQILFEKSGFLNGFERYNLVSNVTSNLNPPGVDVIHLYSVNMDTATAFRYPSDDSFDEEPEVINGNGDGIVPLASLESGRMMWSQNNNRKAFSEKIYNRKSHLGLLKSQQYIQDILNLLE